jgi:hypothetical protein
MAREYVLMVNQDRQLPQTVSPQRISRKGDAFGGSSRGGAFVCGQECNQLFVSLGECLEISASCAKDGAVKRGGGAAAGTRKGKASVVVCHFMSVGTMMLPVSGVDLVTVDPRSEEHDIYCAKCRCSLGVRESNELGGLAAVLSQTIMMDRTARFFVRIDPRVPIIGKYPKPNHNKQINQPTDLLLVRTSIYNSKTRYSPSF